MLWFWNLPPHLSTPSQRPSPTKAEFSVVEKGSQRWPDGEIQTIVPGRIS